jgi:hypothetical protein
LVSSCELPDQVRDDKEEVVMNHVLRLRVNGKEYEVLTEVQRTLLEVLR